MVTRKSADIPERKSRHRRNKWAGFLSGIVGISLGGLLAVGMAFFLYDIKARACPPDTFIYGSTRVGGLLMIMPWFFVGLVGGCTVMNSILERLPWLHAEQASARSRSHTYRSSMRAFIFTMTALFIPATALSIYGVIVGFCASPQGLSIRMTPLSQAMMYNWHEVQRITVVCYRRGRGGPDAFEVSTRDGTTIDLYDQAGSFTSGYIALTEALRDVPVVYERDVRASCDSTLRDIQWPGVIIRKPS